MNWFQDFLLEFYGLFREMAPYLLLGFLFAGLLKAWFPDHNVKKYLGKPGLKSSSLAALAGVPMPLCSCGVIPTGVGLYKSGASKSATTSFFISTPQTGVDSILATYALLGLPFAVIRPIVALITGIFGGMLSSWFDPDQTDKTDKTAKSDHPLQRENRNTSDRIKTVFSYGFGELIEDIVKWLLIGLILAGVLSLIIPESFFTQYVGSPLLEMLMVLVASVPLYICATGSIPLAAVLLMKGLSPGAALVLLMAGPATNIATMTVIGKSMGKRALLLYLLAIMGGAVGFGFLINALLPGSWFLIGHQHAHQHDFLPLWFQHAAAGLLGLLLIRALWIKIFGNPFKKKEVHLINHNTMISTIKIEGMTCHHCQKNVEVNLSKLAGVEHVDVDLASGTATVEGQFDLSAAEETIEGLGYGFKGIES